MAMDIGRAIELGFLRENVPIISKSTGFVCCGPDAGWCEKVHPTIQEAKNCIDRDRGIRAVHPPRSDRVIIRIVNGEFVNLETRA